MGNPDLIVIINDKKVFYFKGSEWDNRNAVITEAVSKFDDYQISIDKMRRNDDGSLNKYADPDWFPKKVNQVKIYESE